MSKIRILLIEDNRMFREGITAIIDAQPDMRVAAATGGNTNSLQVAHQLNPHILLIDLSLRNQNALRIVKSLSRELPEVKVIGMGLIPTQSDVIEFVQAGASGFIMKDATVEDFLTTIRSVAKGMKVVPQSLTASFFANVIDHAFQEGKGRPAHAIRITKREREVVGMIAGGLHNKEIAIRLDIAPDTVKSHVHNILEKLALRSRLQISAYAHNEESL